MPKMIRSFDHVVFLSNKIDKDRFYDHYLCKQIQYNNISIIPNGSDPPINKNLSKKFRDKYKLNQKFLIVCVGKYTKEKNEMMVLKSFLKANVDNSVLVFIGPSVNNYFYKLVNYFKKFKNNKINNNVLFLTNIEMDEIKSAYNDAYLLLNGSKTEYFPVVILESISYGIPYISTNVGCVDQIPGGIIIKSVSEMSKTIRTLINDCALREKLSNEAFQASLNLYNWQSIVDKYEKLFVSLVGAKGE